MYLLTRSNKKKGYLTLNRLFKEEGIKKEYKDQVKDMLSGAIVRLGDLSIEKIEVDERA